MANEPTLERTLPMDQSLARAPRLESIDLLRGLVMVVMVLDHVRDFFGEINRNPTDLSQTSFALFFTRWVTHFCAPVFVFLAGTGAFLTGVRGRSKGELAKFLLIRGIWLIFLEITIVRFGLTFDPTFQFIPLIVFWAIGASMILLAPMVFLPTWLVGAFGLILIFGHNAFDGVSFEPGTTAAVVWGILHRPGLVGTVAGRSIFALYSLVPWVGVLAAGYAIGPVFRLDSRLRRMILMSLGFSAIVLFILLRWSNLYGDPQPWSIQDRSGFTMLSFINCQKYPPSLLYLSMTLGPALVFLGVFDRGAGRLGRPLVTLGRVPLFFYLLQWYLIHLLAIAVIALNGGSVGWMIGGGPFNAPKEYGYSLKVVYLMWGVSLALLYPASAWFAKIKRRGKYWWLSYF